MFQIVISDNTVVGKRRSLSREYLEYVEDLLASPVVRSMNDFIQHGETTTLQHCLNVSWYSFLACRKMGLNARAAARAGLLHDLFLYDWHDRPVGKGGLYHSIFHPRVALRNAKANFELTPLEEECILKHMFPYTLDGAPKSREALIVSMVDKYCCTMETVSSRVEYYITPIFAK